MKSPSSPRSRWVHEALDVRDLPDGDKALGAVFTLFRRGHQVFLHCSSIEGCCSWRAGSPAAIEPITLVEREMCGWDRPIFDGDRLVWTESETLGPRARGHPRLLTRRLDEADTVLVADRVQAGDYDLGGDIIVYVDRHYTLIAVDLASGQRRVLHQPVIEQGYVHNAPSGPTTDGRYMVWTQSAGPDPRTVQGRNDLWGYDLNAGLQFPISREEFNVIPDLNGGALVWEQWRSDQTDVIHATPIQHVLPTPWRCGLGCRVGFLP